MKGLGIDLCDISRIEASMAKNERFLERWYTQEERDYIAARGKTGAQSAAAMFAAKEAFLKAVGTGIGHGITLPDIAVHHDELGAPRYVLTGGAARKMGEMGARCAWLSISHESGMAAAVCVIE